MPPEFPRRKLFPYLAKEAAILTAKTVAAGVLIDVLAACGGGIDPHPKVDPSYLSRWERNAGVIIKHTPPEVYRILAKEVKFLDDNTIVQAVKDAQTEPVPAARFGVPEDFLIKVNLVPVNSADNADAIYNTRPSNFSLLDGKVVMEFTIKSNSDFFRANPGLSPMAQTLMLAHEGDHITQWAQINALTASQQLGGYTPAGRDGYIYAFNANQQYAQGVAEASVWAHNMAAHTHDYGDPIFTGKVLFKNKALAFQSAVSAYKDLLQGRESLPEDLTTLTYWPDWIGFIQDVNGISTPTN